MSFHTIKNWSEKASENNKPDSLFSDTVSPAQFLPNMRKLQAALVNEFKSHGKHILVKDTDYGSHAGDWLFVDLTTNATKDTIISYPTNPNNGDSFLLTYIANDSTSYTLKVGNADLKDVVGKTLLYTFDDTTKQWSDTVILENGGGSSDVEDLEDLKNVVIDTAKIGDGQSLVYKNGQWVNQMVTGAKGEKGDPGADGKDGADGADGQRGPRGLRGPKGDDGADATFNMTYDSATNVLTLG